MSDWLQHESMIRLGCFCSVLLVMMLWEWRQPRRVLSLPRAQRWPANLGIIVVDNLIVRLLFPILAVGMAELVQARGWGLLQLLAVPTPLAILIALLLLDLIVYVQHVAFHRLPLLWRLHRMHHSDTDFDVSTALRFHPLEIMLSLLIKLAAVLLLGAPPLAVLLFELILNASAMFNHGNVRLPERLDRGLRWIVVTPDMHRVHHSVHREETDSNFGFSLSCWDRLFGSYRAQPRDGHEGMRIGLEYFRDARAGRLDRLLLQPFLDPDLRRTEEPS
ncbi:MAG: sterol desaturase family protein [Candidatus Competibacteraceae bacterium]|nr:MAG: sterol desaturase family protein [Candidatus Competibacteraceae bacterium]